MMWTFSSSVSHHIQMRRLLAEFLLLALLSGCRVSPPAQAELVNQFTANRASYELLREMVLSDAIFAVISQGEEFAREPYIFRDPDAVGIPPQRASEYRRLMREANVGRVDVTEEGHVLISMESWGMANRGWRVSAMWRKTPPERLLGSLDEFQKSSNDWEVGYSRADSDWYFRIVW